MSLEIGDTVEVVNRETRTYGQTGRISGFNNSNAPYEFVVTIGGEDAHYRSDELTLLEKATPDVVQYPADGHPEHYTAGLPTGVAAVDVIKAHLAAGGTWDTANALKYILRHHAKNNPTQDIKKAIRCLNMWVAEQEETA